MNLNAPASVSLEPLKLTGLDASTTTNVVLTVNDMTGLRRGWNIVTTAAPFIDTNGHRLPEPAVVMVASASSVSGSCSVPHNSIAYPLTGPVGATPVRVFNATPDSGSGPSTVLLTLKQNIPASTYRGSYTSTWTFSISSGP